MTAPPEADEPTPTAQDVKDRTLHLLDLLAQLARVMAYDVEQPAQSLLNAAPLAAAHTASVLAAHIKTLAQQDPRANGLPYTSPYAAPDEYLTGTLATHMDALYRLCAQLPPQVGGHRYREAWRTLELGVARAVWLRAQVEQPATARDSTVAGLLEQLRPVADLLYALREGTPCPPELEPLERFVLRAEARACASGVRHLVAMLESVQQRSAAA